MGLDEEIAAVAYELYERDGRVDGKDREHWLEAEEIVRAGHVAQQAQRKAKPKSSTASRTTGAKKATAAKKASPKSPTSAAKKKAKRPME